jgi:hypothetical protein
MDIYDSYQNFYTYYWPTLSLGNLEKSKKSKKNQRNCRFFDFSWIFSQFGCQLMLERVSRQLCPGQESNSIDIYDSYQNVYTLNWPALSLGNLKKSKKNPRKIKETADSWIFLGFFHSAARNLLPRPVGMLTSHPRRNTATPLRSRPSPRRHESRASAGIQITKNPRKIKESAISLIFLGFSWIFREYFPKLRVGQ